MKKRLVVFVLLGLTLLGASKAEATLREDGNHFFLENDEVRFAIYKRDGRIAGGWNLSTNERYLVQVTGKYLFQTRTKDKEADETADNLLEVISREPLKLRFENKALPLIITKEYWLIDNRLAKRVSFESAPGGEPGFLTYSTSVVLDENFRNTGFYCGEQELGIIRPAKEVVKREAIRALDVCSKLHLLINFDKGYSFAQYRHKINDNFLLPWDGFEMHAEMRRFSYYTPDGWEMIVADLRIEKPETASVEIHYQIFAGSQISFWRQYRNLPEVRTFYEEVIGDRPEWMNEIKLIAFDHSHGQAFWSVYYEVKRALTLTDEGYILVLMWPMGIWAEYPSTGYTYTIAGGKVTAERMRQQVEKLQQLSPRVKVSFYTWIWAAYLRTNVFRNHPEWFITKDREGRDFVQILFGAPAYYLSISAPGAKEHFLDMYDNLMRHYGLNLHYVDGGAQGPSIIDWQHNRVVQPYDWFDFYNRWRVRTRKMGEEKGLFFNSRHSPWADLGFMELPAAVSPAEDWREVANLMYPIKVLQKFDPKRRVSPLPQRPPVLPYDFNYIIGLGLQAPHSYGTIAQLPYLSAAFEMRDIQLLEAYVSPCWQRDPLTELEVYPLRQGEGSFIYLVNHTGKKDVFVVRTNTEEMLLESGKEAFLWQFIVTHPAIRKGRLTESLARSVYQKTGWGLDLCVQPSFLGPRVLNEDITLNLELPPSVLNMVMITHSPGWVYSVNGKRTNFWMPASLGIDIQGGINRRTKEVSLKVKSNQDEAELLVYFPREWDLKDIKGANAYKNLFWDDNRFLLIPIEKGEKEIVISGREAKPRGFLRSIEILENPRPGKEMIIGIAGEGELERLSLSLAKEGIPYYLNEFSWEETVSLPIPREIAGGKFKLSVRTAGGNALEKEVMMPPGKVKINMPRPPAAAKTETKIEKIDREIRGIKVLRTAKELNQGFEGISPGALANVDVENLILEIGTKDYTECKGASWSAAGLELQGIETLHLRVNNTVFDSFHDHMRIHYKFDAPYRIVWDMGPALMGFVIDFHTGEGYTERAVFFMGGAHRIKDLHLPSYGKGGPPDRIIFLERFDREEHFFSLDLKRYAPSDWDGKVWFSAVSIGAAPARRLKVEILKTGDFPLEPTATIDMTLASKREIRSPFIDFSPVIDGKLDKIVEEKGVKAKDFLSVGSLSLPEAKTEAHIAYNPTSALRQFSSGSPTEELEKVSVTHFDLEKCLSVGSECL